MEEKNSDVFIVGLGHVGNRLLAHAPKGIAIDGSYRRREPAAHPSLRSLHQWSDDQAFPWHAIDNTCRALIWLLPPISHYTELLALAHAHTRPELPWIFTSSTSVYSDGRNSMLLKTCEDQLKSYKRPVTIVRPGGLFDEVRNPAKFFANASIVPNALAPVNLVHSDDVARFIWHVLERKLWNDDFNLVCQDHPLRKDFYGVLLKRQGFDIPLELSAHQAHIVSAEKSLQSGFHYLYPSLKNHFHLD